MGSPEEQVEEELDERLRHILAEAGDDTDLAARRIEHLLRTPRGAMVVLRALRTPRMATFTTNDIMNYGLRIGEIRGEVNSDPNVSGYAAYLNEIIDLAQEILRRACGGDE